MTDYSSTSESSSTVVQSPITVTVNDLSFAVRPVHFLQKCIPVGNIQDTQTSPTGNTVDNGKIELLDKINLCAAPGRLLAIIGPSGCGKTTLLNVIAGRARGTVTSGSVKFNGIAVPCEKLQGAVTMLYSHDRMIPHLTVQETLMFTAVIKMANSSKAQRQDRVQAVMAELSLTHVKDTLIGGAWRKGLSSGELRRTSIAIELIGNPSVMLLDEATSGLDAVLAYEVVYVLRRLAASGRTIICTLHQPRSTIFAMAHDVMLMSHGKILFAGSPNAALPFFSRVLHKQFDESENPADVMIEIASDFTTSETSATTEEKESKVSDRAAKSDDIAQLFRSSEEASSLKAQIEQIEANPEPIAMNRSRNPVKQWLAEVYAVMFRSFWNSLRNPLGFGLAILLQAGVGCLLGSIFFDLPHTYLPKVDKLEAIGEDAAIKSLFNNDYANFFKSGIDGQGTNPILDMLEFGVDGNGSNPIQALIDSHAYKWLGDSMPCMHKRMGLDKIYPNTDFDEYKPLWPGWDAESVLVTGPYTPPVIVQQILQVLQVADHVFYKTQWFPMWKLCRHNPLPLPCYLCNADINWFLIAAAECTGLPPPPTPGAAACTSFVNQDPDAIDYPDTFNLKDRYPKVDGNIINKKTEEPQLFGVMGRYEQVEFYERDAIASAEKRRLQLSGLFTGSLSELSVAIPEIFVKILNTMDDWKAAFNECKHPACVKLAESSMTSEALTSISNYGSVLGAVLNVAGTLFFAVAGVGFASYDALISIAQERAMFNREVANHTYRPSSYFIGRNLADVIFQLLPMMALTITFFFLVGLDTGDHSSRFWAFLGVCIITMYAAYGFAYLMSSLCPTMEVAVVASPLLLVILICCSGFFVRDNALPVGLGWIRYLSMYRWGFFAMVLSQFPVNETYWGLSNSFNLAVIGVGETSIGKCLGMLIVLGTGCRLAAWACLKYVNRSVGVES